MNKKMHKKPFSGVWFVLVLAAGLVGCRASMPNSLNNEIVQIPFMKNSSNECYYLDEFMPVPDGIVSGKNGALNLRYYTYKAANYKEWKTVQINLAFYSTDARCWSLFEEYYSTDVP